MKTIETKYLGEVDINQSKIIQFPSGIPGFLDEDKFVLLHLPDNPIFQILQSVQTPALAFIVVNPYHFYNDYEFRLDEQLIEYLQIKRKEDVSVLAIVTLKQPFKQSTINLKAPLIINTKLNDGKQYVLTSDKYSSKTPIVPEADQSAKVEGD